MNGLWLSCFFLNWIKIHFQLNFWHRCNTSFHFFFLPCCFSKNSDCPTKKRWGHQLKKNSLWNLSNGREILSFNFICAKRARNMPKLTSKPGKPWAYVQKIQIFYNSWYARSRLSHEISYHSTKIGKIFLYPIATKFNCVFLC